MNSQGNVRLTLEKYKCCLYLNKTCPCFFFERERRGGKRPRETEDQLQIPLNINKKINILSAFRSQSHYLQLQANTNLFSSQSRFYIWSMEIFSYAAQFFHFLFSYAQSNLQVRKAKLKRRARELFHGVCVPLLLKRYFSTERNT